MGELRPASQGPRAESREPADSALPFAEALPKAETEGLIPLPCYSDLPSLRCSRDDRRPS